MTEVMERYKPVMVTAHDGALVLYIRFVPDDAGPWVMHHQATALQARVAELETALQSIKDAPDEERKPNFDNMGSYEAGLRYCAAFARAALGETQ